MKLVAEWQRVLRHDSIIKGTNMLSNSLTANSSLTLNVVNHLIYALVIRGVFTGDQADRLLTSIASSMRADNCGQAGEVLAAWLDKAAKQYQA